MLGKAEDGQEEGAAEAAEAEEGLDMERKGKGWWELDKLEREPCFEA